MEPINDLQTALTVIKKNLPQLADFDILVICAVIALLQERETQLTAAEIAELVINGEPTAADIAKTEASLARLNKATATLHIDENSAITEPLLVYSIVTAKIGDKSRKFYDFHRPPVLSKINEVKAAAKTIKRDNAD